MKIGIARYVKVIVLGIFLVSLDVKALILELRPSIQTVSLGSTAAIDLWAVDSDKTKGIGAYDVTINFNPAILSFNSVTFSTLLGTTLGPITTPSFGAVSIADVSLELPSDLLALQTTSDFLLGAFKFNTLSLGTSQLNISNVIIGDAFGDPVLVEGLNVSNIIVTQSAIPEPATALLLIIGALSLFSIKIREKRRKEIQLRQ